MTVEQAYRVAELKYGASVYRVELLETAKDAVVRLRGNLEIAP